MLIGSPKREAKLNQPSRTKSVYESSPLVDPLHALGYSRRDVIQALLLNKGSVEQAGSWLVENAKLEENLQVIKSRSTCVKFVITYLSHRINQLVANMMKNPVKCLSRESNKQNCQRYFTLCFMLRGKLIYNLQTCYLTEEFLAI